MLWKSFAFRFYSTFATKISFPDEIPPTTTVPEVMTQKHEMEDLEKQLLDALDKLAGNYGEK